MGLQGELIADTQCTFRKFAGDLLTTEEARECQENVAGFFRLLAEWQRAATESSLLQTRPEPTINSASAPKTSKPPGNRTRSAHLPPAITLGVRA